MVTQKNHLIESILLSAQNIGIDHVLRLNPANWAIMYLYNEKIDNFTCPKEKIMHKELSLALTLLIQCQINPLKTV